MKNCGYRFHILVTTRDFIEGVLVRSIIPRNNPPLILHDRVLSIVQVRLHQTKTALLLFPGSSGSSLWFSFVEAWADAFRSSPDLTGVVSVYEDLRRKGLEFPMTELDGYSPVQPTKKVPECHGGSCSTAGTASHCLLASFLSDWAWERAGCLHSSCCAALFQTSALPTPGLGAKTGPRWNQCLHSQPGDGPCCSSQINISSFRCAVINR